MPENAKNGLHLFDFHAADKIGTSKNGARAFVRARKPRTVSAPASSTAASDAKPIAVEDKGRAPKSGQSGTGGSTTKMKARTETQKSGILKEAAIENDGRSNGKTKEVVVLPPGFVGLADQLSGEEMAILYRIYDKIESDKWVDLSSRFFDKTGKRLAATLLKEKLAKA